MNATTGTERTFECDACGATFTWSELPADRRSWFEENHEDPPKCPRRCAGDLHEVAR